jgi:hypothetical protein
VLHRDYPRPVLCRQKPARMAQRCLVEGLLLAGVLALWGRPSAKGRGKPPTSRPLGVVAGALAASAAVGRCRLVAFE